MLNSKYYVLTVKDYLPRSDQQVVESEFIEYIQKLWSKFNIRCIFIPTGANPIEENDLPVGERIDKEINSKKIFTIKQPATPEATRKIIKGAKFAICTRMHSAIFAITEFTPFIAIAYEHKSIGLLESLNLAKWCIRMTEVTCDNLMEMSKNLVIKSNYANFLNELKKQRVRILAYREKLKSDIIHNL